MRYYLVLLFLWVSLTLSGTTYYISPTGSDSNNGSSAAPWKTLSYACSKALVPGDIIHVNAGTYIETAKSNLSVGVSIEGEGVTSIIRAQIANDGSALLNLNSATENTNGNQSVSKLKFDGNSFTASFAILVTKRGHVKIYNVEFINFDRGSVNFNGGSEPTTYANGNEFCNNKVTDCSNYLPGCCGYSSVTVVGQEATLIHDNIISLAGRPSGSNGTGISTRYTKGIKIYNNDITNDPTIHEGSPNLYTFSLELWNGRGGTEIYNNNFYNGTVDIAGAFEEKGSYAYSVSLHNNFIGRETLSAYDKIGIIIEGTSSISDVLIYSNTIKNVNKGIVHYSTPGAKYSNISIYYNVFDQIGINKVGSGQRTFGINSHTSSSTSGHTVNNWRIDNNTFIASTVSGGYQNNAIVAPNRTGCTVSNIYIRNNIFVGWDETPVLFESYWGGTIDYLWYQNNNAYGNGHNNDPTLGITPTHYTSSGNIKADPLFTSAANYRLQPTSPCNGAGIAVGLLSDFAGSATKNPPSIGAFENGSTVTVPVPTAPVYVKSTITDASPSLVELNYDINLNSSIIPAVSAFSVTVNGTSASINTVTISGNKALLNLTNIMKAGDVVSISYTMPSTNPLQSTSGGKAASFSGKIATNSLSVPVKSGAATVSMIISPNHIFRTLNISLKYSGTTEEIAALSPEVLTITDASGKLFMQKSLTTGITSFKVALNLKSGIYNVNIVANSVQKATQKVRVY